MIIIEQSWADFKTNVTNRSLTPQYYNNSGSYHIVAVDGFLEFHTELYIEVPTVVASDQEDFELNFMPNWNIPLNSIPGQVKTQKELGVVSTKMARVTGVLDAAGYVEMDITIPSGGREVLGGSAWCDTQSLGTYVVVDVHHPVAGKVDSYSDQDVPVANSGWYEDVNGMVIVQAMDFFGSIPEGLIMKIRMQHGDGAAASGLNAYANIQWGKKS